MLAIAEPWYGGYVESPDRRRSVLSISPELFLEVDPVSRRVVTRPIKGTLPADHSPEQLRNSDKDRAELVMIVDLMRNDLGRLCEFGSVRVEQAQRIERHGGAGVHSGSGVLHGVATVTGTLRAGTTLADLLAATFPAGSVTGAPKIRAMEIIDELEPVRRGPYCGTLGFIGEDGRCCFNVGIRTASIMSGTSSGAGVTPLHRPDACVTDSQSRTTASPVRGSDHVIGTVDYSVGAGIVADSEPKSEWRETEAKAAGFRRAVESFSEAESRAETPA